MGSGPFSVSVVSGGSPFRLCLSFLICKLEAVLSSGNIVTLLLFSHFARGSAALAAQRETTALAPKGHDLDLSVCNSQQKLATLGQQKPFSCQVFKF